MVWATLERRPLLSKAAATRVSGYLAEYATQKGVYMKINFVNADHVHVLVDLPASRPIDELAQLLKGNSSHWVNEQGLVPGKFAWQRGYGAFSVSQSAVGAVSAYIARQEEHHRKKPFAEEMRQFVERYGLRWNEGETAEAVSTTSDAPCTRLKPGANDPSPPPHTP
jgi:REP element-mobilizing transposase RayT